MNYCNTDEWPIVDSRTPTVPSWESSYFQQISHQIQQDIPLADTTEGEYTTSTWNGLKLQQQKCHDLTGSEKTETISFICILLTHCKTESWTSWKPNEDNTVTCEGCDFLCSVFGHNCHSIHLPVGGLFCQPSWISLSFQWRTYGCHDCCSTSLCVLVF